MLRNVDLLRFHRGEIVWNNAVGEPATHPAPSFLAVFFYLRDAFVYVDKARSYSSWSIRGRRDPRLNAKRQRYLGYVKQDIRCAMECLHLAIDALIAANPWIVGGAP